MGKIPRKLNRISGFVRCKFGELPYEDKDDRIKLRALGQIYDKAVEKGTIICKEGKLPVYGDANLAERRTLEVLMAHTIKNIEAINRHYYPEK